MQYLRSILFQIWMYGLMIVMGIAGLPFALWSQRGAFAVMHLYTRIILRSLDLLCGLKSEVRGPVPGGELVIAAKHQSFLDIIMLFNALERPRFVMKRSLRWAPVLGFYAMRIGCAPVNRGAGAKAVDKMVEDTGQQRADRGQTLIYPQGTRVAPGAKAPYKSGVHALAAAHDLPVYPVATNAGLFWPKAAVLRKPGTAVIEFLPPLDKGLSRREMTRALEAVIEPASDALMAEAGFRG